jgi:hypothetical protein
VEWGMRKLQEMFAIFRVGPTLVSLFYERGRAISRDSLKEAKSCRASNNPTSIGKDASILGRHKVRVPFTCTPEQSVSFCS